MRIEFFYVANFSISNLNDILINYPLYPPWKYIKILFGFYEAEVGNLIIRFDGVFLWEIINFIVQVGILFFVTDLIK
jgi:hypothetical protein